MIRRIFMLRNFVICSVLALALAACSSGNNSILPGTGDDTGLNPSTMVGQGTQSGRSLLGLYQWEINLKDETFTAVPLRSSQLHYNVVTDMNGEPPKVTFEGFTIDKANNTIKLDVHLHHPYPDRPNLAGFDVHGIMIGSGSVTGFNDPSIRMAGLNDPHLLNPDGWTRWWNPVEFNIGDDLYSYTDGDQGIKNSVGHYNATLNAYKIFAADLGNMEDYHNLHLPDRLIFTTDAIHTRHYDVWFPTVDNQWVIKYNYAIDASWASIPGYNFGDDVDIPSDWDATANQEEPFMVVTDEMQNSLYFETSAVKGGSAVVQVKVFDWQGYLRDGAVASEIESVMFENPLSYDGVEYATLVDPGDAGMPYATYELTLQGDKVLTSGPMYGFFTVVSAKGDYQPDLTGYTGTAPLSYYTFAELGMVATEFVPDNQLPTASATVLTPDPIYVGDVVQLDASASSDPDGSSLTYSWDFDNNGIFGDSYYGGTDDMPQVIFGWAGDFFVDLKVTDEDNGSDVLDQKLHITVLEPANIPPVAIAFALDQEINIYEPAGFNGSFSYDPDGVIVSWEWDFNNDGVFGDSYDEGTDQMPLIYFSTGGEFLVNLRVTDNSGAQDTLSLGELVTVNVDDPENFPPTAIATVDQLEVQLGEPSLFNGSYSYDVDGAIVSWQWDFNGDGIYGDAYDSGTDQMPVITFALTGVYMVDLKVTDNMGASDTLDENIVISVTDEPQNPDNIAPVAIASAFDNEVQEGETVTFFGSDSYDPDGVIVLYEWDFNNDGIFGDAYDTGSDQVPQISFADAGTYYINLRVTDNDGATDMTNVPVMVEVVENPPAENVPPVAVAGVNKTWAKVNQLVVFHGQYSYDPDGYIVSWEWDFDGDGDYGDSYYNGNDPVPHVKYGTPGEYTVDLRVTDNDGATDYLDEPLTITVIDD